MIDPARLPRHIAVVMDGNGRWAHKRGLPRLFGHRAGVATVRTIVTECSRLGIGYLTLYAFSTENWVRPKTEVSGLMAILRRFLRAELPTMQDNGIRLRTIGDRSRLPVAARAELERVMAETERNTGLTLVLALNYGARDEIVRAVQRLVDDGVTAVTENAVAQRLDTAAFPDPDLFIRTSGEQRLSNFLLWQLAYTELYSTPVLWPDFKPKHLHEAIAAYQARDRRFGGVK